ncbi:hypothetical protein C2S51_026321 [Perilla frutescens var. frutescens]|nr:hypothetical protein C2S51_026321 [Perilla frutescens var. frutescens]
MAQNFVGILEHEGHREDFKVLTNQIRDHESTMRLKHRWLMDLPLSYKEQNYFLPMIMVRVDRIMPESFLREDDATQVSYEDIRTCIKKAFGAQREEHICVQDDEVVLNSCDGFQEISFALDAMSNKGLYSLVRILTGGLNKFDKTNWRMKRLVKELLPKVIADKNDISKTKLKRCSLLLKEPSNFCGNDMAHFTASESYRAAALTVLDEIKSFHSITLRAMCRKLKGDRGYIPTLRTPEPSRSRKKLVNEVRNKCMKMLADIDLKEVLLLLDPEVKLSVKGSLPLVSVRNLLIEYLYECSEMDTVPGVLIEILGIINGRAQRRSRKKSSTSNVFSSSNESVKEEIEKEIEHVVNISAHAKEVVANLLPEHEFDEEFADAYMEDLEESDTLCVFDDDQRFAFRSCSSHDQTESTGEIDPVKFNSSVSASKRDGCSPLSPKGRSNLHLNKLSMSRVSRSPARKSSHTDVKSEETTSCSPSTTKNGVSDFQVEEMDIVHQHSRSANEYLDLQEACDNTSMVAYRFVGYMLDTLAMTEVVGIALMAEAVVSIALQTLGDLLIEKGKLLYGVDDEVKALQTQLTEIKCFLKDADANQHKSETVRNWISQMRDLAYKAEDVVAEYRVRMSSSSSSDGWGRRLLHGFSGVRHSSSLFQLSSEMLHIKSELERITKAMERYGINKIIDGAAVSSDNQILARRSFPNFVIGDCFVGKEEDLKQLVSLVADDKEHPIISVWGMGGIGKTTIAKKVYNQMKEAKNSCFDCFAWVCISQQCQIRTVREDILKQLTQQEKESFSNLSDVQLNDRLCQIQTNKRCLIVVDDLWQISHWNALKHAFPLHNLQSKILVTTRKQKVAEIGFSLQLGLLNMDEGLELLKKKAFPPHGHIPADFQLDEIGEEMVKKCGYLPLAISLIGGVLSKRKSMAEVKENVGAYLYRGDGNIEGENEMHAVLNLSYEDLPYYLKPCFLYLGIFKEDAEIYVNTLYKRWIAQGMISDEMIRGEETLVDIAELYLGQLASRCMLQVEDISPEWRICKLHDLVREFCLSTGKKEEFGVQVLEYRDGNFGSLLPVASRSINKTRHLAIHFEEEGGGDLTITTCRKLPRGITKLVHLRYFGLRHCKHLDKLPSSICNLVYLDTLDLDGSDDLRVPNVFTKMRRFKHLIFPLYIDEETIGDHRLKLDEGVDGLETLERFDSRLHELKPTVRMKNLRRFHGRIHDNKSLFAIVNAIREHWNKLQFCCLWIERDCELRSSSDEVLRLEECEIEDPMPMSMGILGNLHCLTHLNLWGSFVGEEMTCHASSFPRLKYLELYECINLREWRVEQGAMPLLSVLQISRCPHLQKVPDEVVVENFSYCKVDDVFYAVRFE